MSTSSGIIEPVANLGLPGTLRAGPAGWSKTLARKVAADGVTVNTVIPDSLPPGESDSWIRLKRPVCSNQCDGLERVRLRSVRSRNSVIRLSS
jgi:NAD(P)-dependent dehydrogenase (short-subunit alcohol dehydrogenase family)